MTTFIIQLQKEETSVDVCL